MTKETATQKTIKYGSATVGVSVGNAMAYFGLEYMRHKGIYTPPDAVVAMAMGGALMSVFLLEVNHLLSHIGRGLKYVFDRIFPEKGSK